MKEKLHKHILLFTNIVLVALIVVAAFLYQDSTDTHRDQKNKTVRKQSAPVYDDITLEAKAAYMYDVLAEKELYRKNVDTQLPLASITKLMTALVAVEFFSENSKITIKPEFLAEEGDSGLVSGDTWSLKKLLDYSLVVSSNDASRAMASVIGTYSFHRPEYSIGRNDFILHMNQRAKELGLQQTYFVNETGLDVGETSGGYGSAKDVTKLVRYILAEHPEIVEATKYTTYKVDSAEKEYLAQNTNIVVGSIPNILASKTGYTDLAQGNLVVAFDISVGRPIIAVVLGSSAKGRFTDIETLVQHAFAYAKESEE